MIIIWLHLPTPKGSSINQGKIKGWEFEGQSEMAVPSSNNGSKLTGTSLPGSNMYKDTEPNCVIMLGSFLIISFPLQERQIIIFLHRSQTSHSEVSLHTSGAEDWEGMPPKRTQGQFGGSKYSQNVFADNAKHLGGRRHLMFCWDICKWHRGIACQERMVSVMCTSPGHSGWVQLRDHANRLDNSCAKMQ